TMGELVRFGSLVCAALVLIAGCGGSAPPVKRAPAPRPKVQAPPPPPPEPSAFEQRWSATCGDDGAVGECPAPFDHPGVFVDVSESEQATPSFCGALDAPEGAAARDALKAKRK